MGYGPLFGTARFSGIDNITDPLKLRPDGRSAYFTVGLNVDLDDEKRILRRSGYSRKISGSFHSLWSREDRCYAVKDTSLVRVNDDYSTDVVISQVDPFARVSYFYQAGRIYLTNGNIIGYIDESDVFRTFSSISQRYKDPMPPGQLLCFYKNRLLVARDNLIIASDAEVPHYYDIRTNKRPMKGRITMLMPVTDGVFFSADAATHFAGCDDFLKSRRIKKTNSAAIEGTAAFLDGEEIGEADLGTAVLWTSREGVFIGAPGGRVKNLTWDHYVMDNATLGAAIVRDDLPFVQYLSTYELPVDEGLVEVDVTMPSWRVSAIGTIT